MLYNSKIKMQYRKVFEGLTYSIVEDDEASVLFLEGKPVIASCVEHGNHSLFETDCPHVVRLLRKMT